MKFNKKEIAMSLAPINYKNNSDSFNIFDKNTIQSDLLKNTWIDTGIWWIRWVNSNIIPSIQPQFQQQPTKQSIATPRKILPKAKSLSRKYWDLTVFMHCLATPTRQL